MGCQNAPKSDHPLATFSIKASQTHPFWGSGGRSVLLPEGGTHHEERKPQDDGAIEHRNLKAQGIPLDRSVKGWIQVMGDGSNYLRNYPLGEEPSSYTSYFRVIIPRAPAF